MMAQLHPDHHFTMATLPTMVKYSHCTCTHVTCVMHATHTFLTLDLELTADGKPAQTYHKSDQKTLSFR